jgi:hypothetical protein
MSFLEEIISGSDYRTMRQWVSLTIMTTATDFSELNGVLLGINIDLSNGIDGTGARHLRCCGFEVADSGV